MNKKASLSVIFLTVFIDLLGFGILIPILPTFASKDLAVSDFGIGVVVAIFSFVQFIFNPYLGKMSDKFGRRPLILITLLISSISYLIFAYANSFLLLIIARLLAGIGGSNIGVAQAYVADVTTKEERSKGMGIIGAAFGLGFVFGPMIGGFLSEFGYSAVGFASAAFSFMAFTFAFFFLPESIKEKSTVIDKKFQLINFRLAKRIINDKVIGLLVLIFFIIVFSMANIYGTFSLMGYKVYHFSDLQNGYLFGIIGLIGAIIQGGLLNKLNKIFSDKSLILTGIFLMIFGLGLLPYGGNFLGVAVVASILAVGTGLLQPTVLSMISKYSNENEQGSILGMNQSFASLARVFGPLWGGFAYDFIGFQFPFLTGAVFTLITFIIALQMLNSQVLKES